jgi:hypothetical protein
MAVAFAVHDAHEEKLIQETASTYAAATLRLNALNRRLPASAPPMSLLLVDAGLWTQFHPLAVHAAGPRPGDAVILTSDAVLAAVLEGRLPAQLALERGLIVVDGETASADTVRTILRRELALDSGPSRRYKP